MALFVAHGIIRTDRTLDVLRVVEQIRPYLVASSIEMSVESVRNDVAYVRFATGCSAPDQESKDEIMGVIMQRVPGAQGRGGGQGRARRRSSAWTRIRDRPASDPDADMWSAVGPSARPVLRRLGGASPGGLALPDAAPRPAHVRPPRRVDRRPAGGGLRHGEPPGAIWHAFPEADGAPADVVLGQPDFTSEGPAAGGTDPRRGLNLPTGVAMVDGDLVVADAWHHRLLALGRPARPTTSPRPTCVIGQAGLDDVEPEPRRRPGLRLLLLAVRLRVGRWRLLGGRHRQPAGARLARPALPEPGRPADILLGQDDAVGARGQQRRAVGARRSGGPTPSPVTTRPCTSPTRATTGYSAGPPPADGDSAPTWCSASSDRGRTTSSRTGRRGRTACVSPTPS